VQAEPTYQCVNAPMAVMDTTGTDLVNVTGGYDAPTEVIVFL
jgi:hypothetical protein